MNPRPTLRPIDWLLAAIIGVFLVGAAISQAHGAPTRQASGFARQDARNVMMDSACSVADKILHPMRRQASGSPWVRFSV